MTEWKPIETAPKDGTQIEILFTGNEYATGPKRAAWQTTYGGEWHVGEFTHLPFADQRLITHWRPLNGCALNRAAPSADPRDGEIARLKHRIEQLEYAGDGLCDVVIALWPGQSVTAKRWKSLRGDAPNPPGS
jgi:hypothetical protein